jgi:biotin synthase
MISLSQTAILDWLRERGPARIQSLYAHADRVRSAHVGDAIHLRGLIEISSHCERQCMYCGLRRGNAQLERYRLTEEEILACARQSVDLGYGSVVLQAGEDPALHAAWIAGIVRRIKQSTPLAVTLSLGERTFNALRLWRQAGADRYLLRFETSDLSLYQQIHPPRSAAAPNRIELLQALKALGYEAGGGVMVGIPGQSFASLAADIDLFRTLDLDMIGIGPYIPHPHTPLGSGLLRPRIDAKEQVPANEEMVLKTVALARLVRPDANLPATTALATINNTDGRIRAFVAGANVAMPNLTPVEYRRLYQIYPDKACIAESATDCSRCLERQIRSVGRFVGRGQGSRGQREPAPHTFPAHSSLVHLQPTRRTQIA